MFQFPPKTYNEWIPLDYESRQRWLKLACDRFFDTVGPDIRKNNANRVVTIDGSLIDDLQGFYCVFGEAVNGLGGYFGGNMQAFDDCLFGGFGLEPPFDIRWIDSATSRQVLGSEAFLKYLIEEVDEKELYEEGFEEGLEWFRQSKIEAEAGEKCLFSDIVDTIQSVSDRASWHKGITLKLL